LGRRRRGASLLTWSGRLRGALPRRRFGRCRSDRRRLQLKTAGRLLRCRGILAGRLLRRLLTGLLPGLLSRRRILAGRLLRRLLLRRLLPGLLCGLLIWRRILTG
jgi:hypothetical protein